MLYNPALTHPIPVFPLVSHRNPTAAKCIDSVGCKMECFPQSPDLPSFCIQIYLSSGSSTTFSMNPPQPLSTSAVRRFSLTPLLNTLCLEEKLGKCSVCVSFLPISQIHTIYKYILNYFLYKHNAWQIADP